MEQVYNTNVFGLVRVTNHFIPLLENSEQPIIVNVSSGLGSFGMVNDNSKAESKVNSLAYCYKILLPRHWAIAINKCTGWTIFIDGS